jgi:hypothetical protein
MRVTNGIPLGYPSPLTVATATPVQTLKVACIGEAHCPLKVGPGGVSRQRSKPWPLQAACPSSGGEGSIGAGAGGGAAAGGITIFKKNTAAGAGTAESDATDRDSAAAAAAEAGAAGNSDAGGKTAFDMEWEKFWADLQSPSDCEFISNLGGYGARFRQGFTLEDAIEFHAVAPLEVLPCV